MTFDNFGHRYKDKIVLIHPSEKREKMVMKSKIESLIILSSVILVFASAIPASSATSLIPASVSCSMPSIMPQYQTVQTSKTSEAKIFYCTPTDNGTTKYELTGIVAKYPNGTVTVTFPTKFTGVFIQSVTMHGDYSVRFEWREGTVGNHQVYKTAIIVSEP